MVCGRRRCRTNFGPARFRWRLLQVQAHRPLIAEAGYRLIVINQRGIMGSTGALEDLTLHDLADDVIAVADKLGAERFHMAGWAFGIRTSRMLATDYPHRVASVTLIAAGGIVPALTERGELASLLGDQDLSFEEKCAWHAERCFHPPPPTPLSKIT